MIIWVNGPFGVGKTTAAGQLVGLDPTLRHFDPEQVGFMIANNLRDHPVTDFQHHESWRRLTPVVADELVRLTGQHLVAVQSVLHAAYWDELESGLVALGHPIFHVVLHADRAEVERRIDADEVEVTAGAWRHGHLDTYDDARSWLSDRADLTVDTTALTPAEVAGTILQALRAYGKETPSAVEPASGTIEP